MSSSLKKPTNAAARHFDRLVPIEHHRVAFPDGFWKSWSETVRKTTIPTQHKRLEEEGFLEVLDFDKPPAPLARPIQPSGLSMQHFFDSDFGKRRDRRKARTGANGRRLSQQLVHSPRA